MPQGYVGRQLEAEWRRLEKMLALETELSSSRMAAVETEAEIHRLRERVVNAEEQLASSKGEVWNVNREKEEATAARAGGARSRGEGRHGGRGLPPLPGGPRKLQKNK